MNGSLTPIERRLVGAFDARAAQVTPEALRPPAPPSGARVSGRWFVAVAGMAAVVLGVACLVLLGQFRDDQDSHVQPLAPPARTSAAATPPPNPVQSPTRTAPTPVRSDDRRTASPRVSGKPALPAGTVGAPRAVETSRATAPNDPVATPDAVTQTVNSRATG